MDTNQQIKELAKDLCTIHGGHTSYTFCGDCFEAENNYYGCKGLAENLVNLGYKKENKEEK